MRQGCLWVHSVHDHVKVIAPQLIRALYGAALLPTGGRISYLLALQFVRVCFCGGHAHSGGCGGQAMPVGLHGECHFFKHAELGENRGDLGRAGHTAQGALSRQQSSYVLAIKLNAAATAAGSDFAAQLPDQRYFARTSK